MSDGRNDPEALLVGTAEKPAAKTRNTAQWIIIGTRRLERQLWISSIALSPRTVMKSSIMNKNGHDDDIL
jgi:hypothetical protein